jgi:murein DD-endopeptidase MepM/ murein hydrolase activator NlpD
MNLSKIGFLFIAAFGMATVSTQAQDLMARQAPMDRQLRAVDSVSLVKMFHKEQSKMVNNLYTTWTHDHVNAYKNEKKPRYYKIDLRDFTMPTPSRTVTSNFGYRPRFGRKHFGLDIKVYTGDTIVSAFSGKVRIASYDAGGFGYYVVVRHPNGLETVYGHLSKILAREDQVVRSGEPIGLGGNTGHSFGSHLHFETRLLGEAIDPSLMFDFANQDVKSDYYVYRNNSAGGSEVDGDGDGAGSGNVLASTARSEETKAQNQSNGGTLYYKVKHGDTLYSIARNNGLTVSELCHLNGLSNRARIREGQILKCQ